MRDQEIIYKVNETSDLKVVNDLMYIFDKVDMTTAIVLTDEQYKENMIAFADFCDKGFLRGVGKWWKINKDNEEPTEYTTSELFDLYTTTKEKA